MFTMKWHYRFMELAKLVATWSKDTSTKTGAVIVGPDKEIRATGYNGFVRGVDDDVFERFERPTKYDFLNMRKETPYIMPACAEPALKVAFCMQRISPVRTARAPSFSPA